MDLTVIIVNYNARYFLEQCLYSLDRALKNLDAEIIIVDNHSSDGSPDWIRSRFPPIHYITNNENLGFARANNQALTMARGRMVLFLNPDTIVGEDCIRVCLRFAEEEKNIGAIGLRMIDGQGKFLPESKRGFPVPATAFYKLFGLARIFPSSTHFNSYYQTAVQETDNHPIDVVAGAFMMVNRSLLESLGGFDERFFMYGEDIDLSYRIALNGFTNYYLGHQTIIHFKGESTLKGPAYLDQFYKAMEQFLDKHFSGRYSTAQLRVIRSGIRLRKMTAHFFARKAIARSRPPGIISSFLIGDKNSIAKLSTRLIAHGRQAVDKISEAGEIIFCEGKEYPFSRIIGFMEDHQGENFFRIHAEGSESIVGSDSRERSGLTLAL